MVTFPNCKINLGLNILQKRNDGFHDLATIFYPIELKDVLEIIPARNIEQQQSSIQFTTSGLVVDGNSTDNICFKAYELLKADFPTLPPIEMHLHKAIPMGAGLGGGSADGAFALKTLNAKFNLNLTVQQLIDYALQLGSDCPFFIINQPCFATSRGEKMTPIHLDLSAYTFVIVNPGIHVNTGWAFKQITPSVPAKSIQQIIQQPIETWKHELLNDFELPVATAYPAIQNIKQDLYAKGAVYASMSGSGSTVFGIFKKGTEKVNYTAEGYFVKEI
jgi:4-diphosphocytidyl-2-C-methyl-D-erythritol kinase